MTLVQSRPFHGPDSGADALPTLALGAHGDEAAFAQLLTRYDVVSFDIFDTLLARRVARPEDVFELVARICGVPSFARVRVAAEEVARARRFEADGSREITLDDIYDEVACQLPRHAGRLRQEEIAVERRVLYANPAGARALAAARRAGRRVIAISDMYLPAALLRAILAENGVAVDEVFVSGELGVSKGEGGKAFPLVAARIGVTAGRILHVGDNGRADFENALRAGLGAWLLVSRNDRLFRDWRLNQAGIGALMAAPGNLFGSFLVAEMGRRLERAGFDEAIGLFGAMYAAPYLFAFASWLEDVRRRDGVRRLLLLTRDGHALLPVLRMIGSDAQIELMHSSRRMMYFATLEESFERTCAELAEGVQGSTPRAFLTGLETAGTARLLDAVGAVIGLDGKIETSEDVAAMTRALLACRAELLALAREERAGLCAYLEALNPGAEDTAIVDCGWALNTHRRLERLTGGPIRGYYVGTSDAAKAHRRIRSFLFAAKDGSTWHELHWRSAELLELPFIAAERRAVRMGAGAPVPGVVLSTGNGGGEAVRAEIARRIHAEVAAFCAAAAPMRGWFDHQEAGAALLLLFTALTRHPTPFEYFTLAAIPHGRSVGEHEVRSVGEYWKCALAPDGGGGGAVHPLRRYLGLTLRSLRRDGLRMTAGRVRRKLRVVMRRRMPGAVGG